MTGWAGSETARQQGTAGNVRLEPFDNPHARFARAWDICSGGLMLLDGKRGLVLGIANKRSIAWGIAQAVSREGARLALT